eukprot:TRINITY_DN2490_c0_g2_i1.p1 TRINITY_DN2490_c0_g2~~TRINITY_DN2490_c0_g2_i1.p1  ORF type:complete len:344 (+),score=56.71 TRINITY_DN2490_c0_g2_i1:56-1087(+)
MNEFNHSQNSALQKKIMRWAIGPTLQLLQAQSRDQESLIEADPKITEANGKDNSDSILIPQFLQPKFETLTQRRNYKLGLRSSHKKYAKDKQDIPPSQDLSIRRQKWSPFDDPKATKKPHKTIFVSNLNFKTTEETLQKEFSIFGKISVCRVVRNVIDNSSRGYGFIEYKHMDGYESAIQSKPRIIVDGFHVHVDRERGRLQKGWRPRRLGGGLGSFKKGTQRLYHKDPYFGVKDRMRRDYEPKKDDTHQIPFEKDRQTVAEEARSDGIRERMRSLDYRQERPRGNSRCNGTERDSEIGSDRDRDRDRDRARDRDRDGFRDRDRERDRDAGGDGKRERGERCR